MKTKKFNIVSHVSFTFYNLVGKILYKLKLKIIHMTLLILIFFIFFLKMLCTCEPAI